jgi:methylmalonyl-CoA carboxyltransferase small subunit
LKLRITIDGKAYDVDVEVSEEEMRPARPYYRARPPAVSAPPPAVFSGSAGGSVVAAAEEVKVVRAPVTGVVVRVNAHPGQQIQVNDPLLVLEAMKMETNITSPVAGKVKAVHASSGEGVQSGQVLVEFE